MPASVQFPTPLLTPTVYAGNAVVATPVVLRGYTGGVVTVDYTTIDETAAAGTDYQASSGVLTFAPGQTSQPIDIPILGAIGDPDNTFQVVLSNPSGAALAIPVQTITFTVANPVALSSPGGQSNYDGDTVSLPVSASDALGNSLTFSDVAAGADTLPPGLSIDPNTGIISGTIASNADQYGPYTVTITATDATASVGASQTFSWAVAQPTVTLTSPGDQSNYDGDTVSLGISASDTASHTLTYGASGLPSGLSVNTSTGVISGTVASDADAGGPYSVTVTAADSAADASASQTFSWAVAQPTITLTSPGDQSNYDGDAVSLGISASEDAGHALTFSATGLPAGLSINGTTGVVSGIVASDADVGGPYSATVSAADSSADVSATQTFSWAVAPVLVTAFTPGDQINTAGKSVSVGVFALDSAGNTLIFSATGLPAGLSIAPGTGVIAGTVSSSAISPTAYNVTVTATDASVDVSDTANFNWSVTAVSLASPGDQRALVGATINLALSADDTLGDSLAYGAGGLPPGLSIDSANGQITGSVTTAGKYYVAVTATDTANGTSAAQAFTLNIAQIFLTKSGQAIKPRREYGQPRSFRPCARRRRHCIQRRRPAAWFDHRCKQRSDRRFADHRRQLQRECDRKRRHDGGRREPHVQHGHLFVRCPAAASSDFSR